MLLTLSFPIFFSIEYFSLFFVVFHHCIVMFCPNWSLLCLITHSPSLSLCIYICSPFQSFSVCLPARFGSLFTCLLVFPLLFLGELFCLQVFIPTCFLWLFFPKHNCVSVLLNSHKTHLCKKKGGGEISNSYDSEWQREVFIFLRHGSFTSLFLYLVCFLFCFFPELDAWIFKPRFEFTVKKKHRKRKTKNILPESSTCFTWLCQISWDGGFLHLDRLMLCCIKSHSHGWQPVVSDGSSFGWRRRVSNGADCILLLVKSIWVTLFDPHVSPHTNACVCL